MVQTYAKPAVRDAWADVAASPTDIVDPGNAFVAAGWLEGPQPPPRQYFNWALNWPSAAIRYFCQKGVVDFDPIETYAQYAIVRGDNNCLFQSLVNSNTGNTPSTSPASWASLSLYPQTPFEKAANVMPVNFSFPTSFGHHAGRYGFLGNWNATTQTGADDSAALAQLALVMGQGATGYIPPLPFMIKTTPTIAAPSYQKTALFAYGATMYTTGAIYGIKVTGGFMGGVDIIGLTHNNTTDTLCQGAINLFGCQNSKVIDCWASISGTQGSSQQYALVTIQPGDPTNDNTGAFWNEVVNCGIRQPNGNTAYYVPFGVLILGASNACKVIGGNYTSANYAVAIYNQTSAGQTGTLANSIIVRDVPFEGGTQAVLVNGQGFSGAHIEGLRVLSCRCESLSGGFLLLQGLGADSNEPTTLRDNTFVSSSVNYITQNNTGGLIVTVNSDDPGLTPSYATPITFTAGLSATNMGANLTVNWPYASGQWQVQLSDGETPQTNFVNGSQAITFTSPLTGSSTVNASVVMGATTNVTSNGARNYRNIAGDAYVMTAPTEYGTTVGTTLTHNIRLRNRAGNGGYISFPNNGDLRGIDGIGHTPGVRRTNFTGVVSFAGSASAAVSFGSNPEPDANYAIFFVPTTASGVIQVAASPAQTASGFTATAASSFTGSVRWFLIGL